MRNVRSMRQERSVSMELMPDDSIRLSEITAEGSENALSVPIESVGPLAFALLNEKMYGRLDAVEILKRFLAEHGISHHEA